MRWKQNLVFNNDDGKKTVQKTIYIKKLIKCTENYLHKKINKKFNYYPPSPHFLFLFFALWK